MVERIQNYSDLLVQAPQEIIGSPLILRAAEKLQTLPLPQFNRSYNL